MGPRTLEFFGRVGFGRDLFFAHVGTPVGVRVVSGELSAREGAEGIVGLAEIDAGIMAECRRLLGDDARQPSRTSVTS